MKNTITLFVMLLAVISASNASFSQTQIGEDIDGVVDEYAGSSVSLSSDGTRVAIGAPSDAVTMGGHARVYEWDGGSWTQMGQDIGAEALKWGSIVSLSSDGTRVIIGAPGDKFSGHTGRVGVFEWDGGSWTQMGEDFVGETGLDGFGGIVSLSSDGTRIAIRSSPANNGYMGQVQVYEWDGGSWTQMGADIEGEVAWECFGCGVSLSSDGTKVAIGVPGNDGNGNNTGQVQVYEWDGGIWEQVGVDIDGEVEDGGLGSFVSLSSDGTKVAIGGTAGSHSAPLVGFVQVYEWNDGSWMQMGEDIVGEAEGDRSGRSVSLSSDGTRVAIGASRNDGNGTDAGHVRVYEWDGGSWTQVGVDIDGEAEGDRSGSSVSLSSDGTRVAIGAPWNDGNGPWAGHVRVYELTTVSTTTINTSSMISVFPNPTAGKIELFRVENGTIRIVDKIGRVILEVEHPGSEIDISDLATGVYFVQISSDNHWITKKIIKR